jgi:hypothetical protein
MRQDYVLTGLDRYPDRQAVENMGPYDQLPPASRQFIANHHRPIIFGRAPDGNVAMIALH